MNFAYAVLHLLRWQLLTLVTAALLGGVLYFYSDSYARQAQRNLHNAHSQLDDAQQRLTTAQQDSENLGSYQTQYTSLEKIKFIGNGQRLDWLEGLEKIRSKNLVADFRYYIAPQRRYTSNPAIDSGNFDIHYSEMKLQFDLLHEAQLIRFFDALRANINGHYQLDGCTLQRQPANTATGGAPQLKAECSGGWITLKHRNSPP